MNIEKPVLIPSGGIRIFRVETGLLVSRNRHAITAAAPRSDVITRTAGETFSSTSNNIA